MEDSKHEAKTHTMYSNSLNESRFKVLLFLYRMGGIPLHMTSVSRHNAVYNVIVNVCFYITNIGVGGSTFVHKHQLKIAMQMFRILLSLQTTMWSHFIFR